MSHVKVLIQFQARDGKHTDLLSWLRDIAPKVVENPSCSTATLYENVEDAGRPMLIEEWASVEAHKAHVAGLVEGGAMDQVMGLLTAPPAPTYLRQR